MNGNRGAKGSIKDRLISMLYRFRYKKKILKEENYKIESKQFQKKYLNLLNSFKETENVDVLDTHDKEALNNVKFTAIYSVNPKKGISLNQKGLYKNVDIELNNIELKTHELDEKVEIKKEIRKTKDEINILKEVDSFIKKSKETIEGITNEVNELKETSKTKNKDTKEMEEKYKKLREKVEKLKQQFDAVKDKYDLSEFSILESVKLIESVKDYKSVASLNEMDMMLKVCKTEFDKIKGITVVYEKQKHIGSNIEEVKQEQKQIKIRFVNNKEKIEELRLIEENIKFELNNQKKIIDEMYSKASFFEKEIIKNTELVLKGKLVSSIFRIAGGILTLPLTGLNLFRKSLGLTMINKGLKDLNNNFETHEKLEVKYNCEDISKQISEVKDKVEYINLILIDSLNEIKKLKENFGTIYKEYKDIIPDYNDTLNKIESLESKLIEEQLKITQMDNKLNKENDINKQKLKRIGE